MLLGTSDSTTRRTRYVALQLGYSGWISGGFGWEEFGFGEGFGRFGVLVAVSCVSGILDRTLMCNLDYAGSLKDMRLACFSRSV